MAPILLLDGPTGTELERRGVDTSRSLWSARAIDESPDLLATVHREYLEAGVDILTANTFRTNSRAVAASGGSPGEARRLTSVAVRIARVARDRWATRPVSIAGSVAPVEDCYTPRLVPDDVALEREHRAHVAALQDAGCDLILVETMNTFREAIIAAGACRDRGARFFVSVVPDQSGMRLLSGESLEDVALRLGATGPEAVLVNCASPSATARAAVELQRARHASGSAWDFGVYANGGEPDPMLGYRNVRLVGIDEYLASVERALELGATIVGSCCGTTPATTRALRRLIDQRMSFSDGDMSADHE